MKKRLISLVTVLAISATFVLSFAMAGGDAYAASNTKKYYLPTEVQVSDYSGDKTYNLTWKNLKYDKYGNLKSATTNRMTTYYKYSNKYRNNKGTLSLTTFGYGIGTAKKYYNKKGVLTKEVVDGVYTFKFTTNKKGIITKVTLDGKSYYKVKTVKYHKNGFVSKIVYSNGNVNNYNADGLLTSAASKDGTKYTYKYTKKNGKVVKMVEKKNGKTITQWKLKYGKTTTKDVWKYSCLMNFVGGPSNACEIYSKCALSGINSAW